LTGSVPWVTLHVIVRSQLRSLTADRSFHYLNESMLRNALKPALLAAGEMLWIIVAGEDIEAGC